MIEHPNGNRKALELECYDEITKQAYFVLMHPGKGTLLKSIEVQEQVGSGRKAKRNTIFYYSMRVGKGLVPGEELSEEATTSGVPTEEDEENKKKK